MTLKDVNKMPSTDPGNLLRLRDSIYAPDLFIAAELDKILENAGFSEIKYVPTAANCSIITGKKDINPGI